MTEIYQGFSPYNYTLNNPIKLIDPNGMWVESSDGYYTDDPDDIREFFNSSLKKPIDECCAKEKNGSSENLELNDHKDFHFDEVYSEWVKWIGVELAIVEEGTDYVKSSKRIVKPVYNKTGKAIAGWNVISKQTGQVLKHIKAGASILGYATGGVSIVINTMDLANDNMSLSSYSYQITGTVITTAAAFYLSAGVGALAGATFILGEHAYEGWMENIQPEINKGYYDTRRAINKGWVPFR